MPIIGDDHTLRRDIASDQRPTHFTSFLGGVSLMPTTTWFLRVLSLTTGAAYRRSVPVTSKRLAARTTVLPLMLRHLPQTRRAAALTSLALTEVLDLSSDPLSQHISWSSLRRTRVEPHEDERVQTPRTFHIKMEGAANPLRTAGQRTVSNSHNTLIVFPSAVGCLPVRVPEESASVISRQLALARERPPVRSEV